jgi:hypothetical protein
MNNLSNNSVSKSFGSLPANLKWNVVRGDTASLLVQFLENDEETSYDTATWTYISSAYDHETEVTYILDTEIIENSVKITARPEVTALWGTRFLDKVADLSFDLQVTMDLDVVWTPIVGKISVVGNVTGYAQEQI